MKKIIIILIASFSLAVTAKAQSLHVGEWRRGRGRRRLAEAPKSRLLNLGKAETFKGQIPPSSLGLNRSGRHWR